MICRGCGGIVGRDCFNPPECEWISRDMEARAAADHVFSQRAEAEYYAAMEREHYAQMEADYLTDLAEQGYMAGLA